MALFIEGFDDLGCRRLGDMLDYFEPLAKHMAV